MRASKSPKTPQQTVANGNTYVLVPVKQYERWVARDMVENAAAELNSGKKIKWTSARDLAYELAAKRIVAARKAAGLTQKQLGEKLKLPQSQISRIERNPDHTTVKTLRKIAKALNVDVSALV